MISPFLRACAPPVVALSLLAPAVAAGEPAQTPGAARPAATAPPPAPPGARTQEAGAWQPLFDGRSLGNWKPSKFARQSAVTVEDGRIVMEAGGPMSGITWGGPALPRTGYEIALQAMRIEGSDFFAGITFPVADAFCSLILGGWGGTTVGLSSINGRDASENDTTRSIEFESGRWYAVRIRVTPEKIEAWLDDQQIVDQPLAGRTLSTRIEVEPSQPLGIAAYRTRAALKDLRLRPLPR